MQMTAKQAIGWITRKYAIDEKSETSIALNMAVDALMKQVPKKVLAEKKCKFDAVGIGICPLCGQGCNSDMAYCDRCGQRLKWEG